tara:strand:+ start:1 stop:1263 length:1263 start_codon:yes stop_codon:yes gene_type:complete
MKKLLLLLLFIPMVGFGQYTSLDCLSFRKLRTPDSEEWNDSRTEAFYEGRLVVDAKTYNALKKISNIYKIYPPVLIQCNSEREYSETDILIAGLKGEELNQISSYGNFAIRLDGIDYIFYNKKTFEILDSINEWGSLFVLAHEVGHHINGETLENDINPQRIINVNQQNYLTESRQDELNADEFAGFTLARLGATKQDLDAITNALFKESSSDAIVRILFDLEKLSTHPNKSERVIAVEKGFYKDSNEGLNQYVKSKNKAHKAYDIFLDASLEADWGINLAFKDEKESYVVINRAIEYYKEAISIYPFFPEAYFKLAYAQYVNGSFNKSVESFNKALEFDNESRYEIKRNLGLTFERGLTYYLRGISKFKSGDKNGACLDWKTSYELGYMPENSWNDDYPFYQIYFNTEKFKTPIDTYCN